MAVWVSAGREAGAAAGAAGQAGQAKVTGDIRRSKVAVVQNRPPPTTMLRTFTIMKAGPTFALLPKVVGEGMRTGIDTADAEHVYIKAKTAEL